MQYLVPDFTGAGFEAAQMHRVVQAPRMHSGITYWDTIACVLVDDRVVVPAGPDFDPIDFAAEDFFVA